MISTTRHIALSIILAATVFTATAQEISTEVEIRYKETPQLREFNKMDLIPAISLPNEKNATLPYNTGDVRVGVPGSITTLEATSYADTIYTSPWRGYAALGFMPKFNLGASAGYKILDNDHTRLNTWLQYDGTVYKGTPMTNANAAYNRAIYVRRNTATIGANLHQAVGHESFIDAGIDYSFSRFNTPSYEQMMNQNLHRLNISALWTLSYNDFEYGLGAFYKRFAPTNSPGYDCYYPSQYYLHPPTRENRIGATGFFSGKFAGTSSAGIRIDLSHQSYNHLGATEYGSSTLRHIGKTHNTLLTLAPRYRFDVNEFKLDLGVNIDLAFNSGEVFHIAPDAQATWLPSDIVKVYIKARGGQHQNTLSSLFDITPYARPFTAMRNSQVIVDAEAGVTVGNWKGFYAEISFNYSITDNWLIAVTDPELSTTFTAVDMRGYKLRGALGYNYRNIIDVSASYETAPQKIRHGYYQWADRAKTVVNADLCITPIKPLDINVGWEYRGGRATLFDGTAIGTGQDISLCSLRSVNSLKAGAFYRITPQWSAFLRGENLLNRHYYLIGGLPGQGITGLAGVTYKF